MFFRQRKSKDLGDILKGCIKKEAKAQRQLVENYYSFAKRVCLRYASNKMDAEEIVNDGFIKILSKPENFDMEKPFEPWLTTIMIRTAIDFVRKKNPLVPIDDLGETFAFSGDISGIDALSEEEILSLVQQLPPVYRMVFNLAAVEGYSHEEIGEMLGISPSTSRSNLVKARAKLQFWIQQLSTENNLQTGKHVIAAFR